MAWTAGSDVTTGDLITAANWNTYLGASSSIDYLKANKRDKECWFPATGIAEGAATVKSYGILCNGEDEAGGIEGHVPSDFTSLTSISLLVLPVATQGAANWDIAVNYGATGEAYNMHTGADAASTYNVTNMQYFEIDITSLFASLAVDDHINVALTQKTVAHNVYVTGLIFKYT